MAQGPAQGLALLDDPEMADALAEYHLYHATRADLLRRAGRPGEAAAVYRDARSRTANAAERSFLDRRLEELSQLTTIAGDGTGPG
jgi:RNA polymerase sigma-70 factor (ECF subfamily)